MDETQAKTITAIQSGIPISAEPFREVAEKLGVSEDALLDQLRTWKNDGTIRRFGAILRHTEAGFSVNAMGVWNVPAERIEDFARAATSSDAVSHCYQRPGFDRFPYNLYTMIHGRSRDECAETARRISEQTGITEYELLFTTEEFKKSPPVYFAEDGEHRHPQE
jgi:DNA-binding Lrp family transcriptional regulator